MPSAEAARPWPVLAVLCLCAFAVNVDTTLVNVALPTLSLELEASTRELQWIVDGYNLFFAALVLAAGSLGDRIGAGRCWSRAWSSTASATGSRRSWTRPASSSSRAASWASARR
jgi:MFS family permease